MNQWRGYCQRCCAKAGVYIMSMFNTELICMDCKDAEKKRPDYRAAEVQDLREYADRLESEYKMFNVAVNVRKQADTMEASDG